MKPTNEERREVAARLREIDTHRLYDATDEVDSLETAIGCSIGQVDFESDEPNYCPNCGTRVVE